MKKKKEPEPSAPENNDPPPRRYTERLERKLTSAERLASAAVHVGSIEAIEAFELRTREIASERKVTLRVRAAGSHECGRLVGAAGARGTSSALGVHTNRDAHAPPTAHDQPRRAMSMQNAHLRAAWVARDGRRVAAVIDMPPAQLERPLAELVVERCTVCGVLGPNTFPTETGPRVARSISVPAEPRPPRSTR